MKTLEKLRLANGDSLKKGSYIICLKRPNKFYPNIKAKNRRFELLDADLRFQLFRRKCFGITHKVPDMLNSKFN
jgi:hypothetical protein